MKLLPSNSRRESSGQSMFNSLGSADLPIAEAESASMRSHQHKMSSGAGNLWNNQPLT